MNLKKDLKRMVALAVLFLLPFTLSGQQNDLGNWFVYIGNKKLNNNWNLHTEVQYRNYNFIGDLEQLLLRTGLGYTFNDQKSNILLGYGYILSENYLQATKDKNTVNEHRIFQQFTSKQSIGSVALNHRYRFEQRFIESDFKMRFRYFLGVQIPFSPKESNKYYVSAYNEIFLNTQSSVFDRNRVYAGIGVHLSKKVRLEAGYMNQIFENSGRDQLNIMTFINF
ncbi:hypothetical protein GCM10011416_16710 [Polaribacter pacificus]|uniref:DUF2490 domain-containing protein n=1 Tax=Polaribacter pacificus TaxID=1775173 RepID=A0A917MEI9_9FLAO|nr:DUF2490 domain-containing protein [Polaribacter pacificus]GGG99106.1 hypothetical protein GCM10011416_16710 [Polaribacter pacificus]